MRAKHRKTRNATLNEKLGLTSSCEKDISDQRTLKKSWLKNYFEGTKKRGQKQIFEAAASFEGGGQEAPEGF